TGAGASWMAGSSPAMTVRWGRSQETEDVPSNKARCLDEAFQSDLRSRADVADDFGSAQAADLAANRERQAAGQPIEKAGGIKIASAGAIDDPRHRRRGNLVRRIAAKDHAARGAAGQRRDLDMVANRVRNGVEVLALV